MTGPEPLLLEAQGLAKAYPLPGAPLVDRLRGRTDLLRAVDGVDLQLRAGECLAVVGESGSGKTTLGRCLLRLVEPDAGSVWFKGENLRALSGATLRRRRRRFQMVFQDPQESLNPRMRLGEIIAEPLSAHRVVPRERRRDRVLELLELVGLDAEAIDRFPHQFSGGQRQRIGIARALAPEPELLVADEPVSALDLLSQAQVMRLLHDLQRRLALGVLFIAHDLAAVAKLADRVAVMHRGRIVEEAATEELFARPTHPYTRELLQAVPRLAPGGRGRPGRALRPGVPAHGSGQTSEEAPSEAEKEAP